MDAPLITDLCRKQNSARIYWLQYQEDWGHEQRHPLSDCTIEGQRTVVATEGVKPAEIDRWMELAPCINERCISR